MSGYSAAAVETLKLIQTTLLSLQLQLATDSYLCPSSSTIDTINAVSSFDHVIVGAGTAGSILAYRLSKTNATVLVIEEGGCPPFESNLPSYFSLLALSQYDHALNIYNDSYSCQNVQLTGGATVGKMLGGSSSIDHLIHVTPAEQDFDWDLADDSSWNYDHMIKYIAKSENVKDKCVLAQSTSLHGTSGPIHLKTQKSDVLKDIITAHKEMGIPYKADADGISVSPALHSIDNLRQSGNVAYLSKIKKGNIYFLTGAKATKILFEGKKAIGVRYVHNNSSYEVLARNVIISAGALLTPQLLMLSGIGDANTLNLFNITTVVDNPDVGQNLLDQAGAVYAIALDSEPTQPITDPHEFPVPVLISHGALGTSNKATRQDVLLYFSQNSTGLLQLCTYVFKYHYSICDAWYEYNINRNVLLIPTNIINPLSKGNITIKSGDINVQPEIVLGILSNSSDLDNFGRLVQDYAKIINTTALQKLGAEIIDVGVCSEHTKFSLDFWKCYLLEMSITYWSYMGSCSINKVVDTNLNVIGTTNLKVVDASIIPKLAYGKTGSIVRAVAEKAYDIIKKENGLVDEGDCY